MAQHYQTIAQSFLKAYPMGKVVTGNQILNYIRDHDDDGEFKADLAQEDSDKRLRALVRHLNVGAHSDELAEEKRFHLTLRNKEAKTYIVQSHIDYQKGKAADAWKDTIAIPTRKVRDGQKALEAIKVDDLEPMAQDAIETARKNLAALEERVVPALHEEVQLIWCKRLGEIGYTKDQALGILKQLPEFTDLQKLHKLTAPSA
jgi:hypothetical protein